MNAVWIRMVLYTIAPVAASFGFGIFDAEAGTLTLNLNELSIALGASALFNGAVFKIWGVK